MATGVNVKMGVSGVSKFKQDINAVKQSVKTMDQALALNEKQFKATGDAEEYMATKSELLEARLAAQKSVISNAEKALKQMTDQGVDKASRAFQEMQRTLLQAKGELIDTEQSMRDIAEDGEDAANGVSSMNTQLKNIGKQVSFETVKSGIEGITGAMEKAAKWAWKLGEALVRNVLGAGSYADELKTTADQTGIDVVTLQRMRKTALLIDTDADTIISARDKLEKSMGKTSSQETMGAFAALGIDPSDHNVEDTFWAAGEALLNMTDSVEQETYAQQIFGKSWKELLPLFKTGREEYESTMKSWNVLTKEQVENLGKMDDSYQTMSAEWETFKMSMLETLSGPMTQIMDTITNLLQELNKYLSSEEGQAMMQELGDAMTEFFAGLKDVDFKDVVEKVKGALDGIKGAFDWIVENKDSIVTAIGALAVAFTGLKLAGLAVSLGQLVSGFKNMFGLGGGGEEAAAAASGGGYFSRIHGKLTGVASKGAELIGNTGMFFPAAFDWFMNGTNTGRAARDGLDIWEGLNQDLAEVTGNFKHNMETFESDWNDVFENNPIFRALLRRDENADAATRLESGADWRGSAYGGMRVPTQVSQVPTAVNQAPSYMGGGLVGSSARGNDLSSFLALPAEMQTAVMTGVMRGMSNVTIVVDGPQMVSTVGAGMANMMLMATK